MKIVRTWDSTVFQHHPYRGSYRSWAAGLVTEPVDVFRRALHDAVSNQGVPTSQGEAVLAGGVQSDTGHVRLERIEGHLRPGHVRARFPSGENRVARFPGRPYLPGQVQRRPRLDVELERGDQGQRPDAGDGSPVREA